MCSIPRERKKFIHVMRAQHQRQPAQSQLNMPISRVLRMSIPRKQKQNRKYSKLADGEKLEPLLFSRSRKVSSYVCTYASVVSSRCTFVLFVETARLPRASPASSGQRGERVGAHLHHLLYSPCLRATSLTPTVADPPTVPCTSNPREPTAPPQGRLHGSKRLTPRRASRSEVHLQTTTTWTPRATSWSNHEAITNWMTRLDSESPTSHAW